MNRRELELEERARARLVALTAAPPPRGRRHDGPDDLLDEGEADESWAVAGTPARGIGVLAPAVAFTRGHLVGVCAVLLLALVATAMVLVRARATAVPLSEATVVAAGTPAATQVAPAPGPPAPAGGPPSPVHPTPASRLRVHVLGAVARPGVVTLPAGARVQDAIASCGGLRRGADPAELNLAAPLVDGDQVVLGTREQPRGEVRHAGQDASSSAPVRATGGGGAAPRGGSTPGGDGGATIDLNSATVDQLDQLPGVGPVTAQKILDWREEHQRFSRVDELQEVDGIGPKTYERLRDHVRV